MSAIFLALYFNLTSVPKRDYQHNNPYIQLGKKMNEKLPVRTLDNLTDEEIEDCFDGSSNVNLVRSLLKDNLALDGWVWGIDFGHAFAEAIESFIGADEGTTEWDEAWDINCEWGERIADNINNLLAGKIDD